LIDHTVGHDPQLMAKMVAALAAEPLLSAGAMMPPAARAYLQAAAASMAPTPTPGPAARKARTASA
jgi:hypothetical protein